MSPHAAFVAAIGRLIDRRCEDPLAAIPVMSTDEFLALVDLPDTGGRPPSLVDRLAGAGLRRGYHLTH